jgi:hypothetical protein
VIGKAVVTEDEDWDFERPPFPTRVTRVSGTRTQYLEGESA